MTNHTIDTPILAGVVFRTKQPVDAAIEAARIALTDRGVRVDGVRQDRVHDPETGRQTLIVRDLRDTWSLPILEPRGDAATGCRLDPHAIADLSVRLDTLFDPSPDLLLVNRFGRAESEERGLRDVFEKAALNHIPLLVAVREDYVESWQSFHGGMGTELPMDCDAILAWWDRLSIASAAE
ncbi:DUF2478 domain-containing protein [Rhodospirillaceae bacterium KN72]|uniref:DUF2478 domain-containing protein n=1 Tax=Pacificispira spongiicola TaxID=2729598 RepID=A0A7Y0HI29_9PROT|nr:DUF2478 domain-containing protein [Pacificispira spongiicola]NMM46537.1 DUF2478 domain-containing protein [Pacificispira spongiicola]